MSFDVEYDADEAIEMTEGRINLFDTRIQGKEGMQALGDFLVSKVKSEIQNEGHVVTGELLGDVRILDIGDDFVTVGSTLIQASVLENGRIEITKKDGVLAWQDPDSGEMVFSHKSKAVEPTHIFERSIRQGLIEYCKQLSEM